MWSAEGPLANVSPRCHLYITVKLDASLIHVVRHEIIHSFLHPCAIHVYALLFARLYVQSCTCGCTYMHINSWHAWMYAFVYGCVIVYGYTDTLTTYVCVCMCAHPCMLKAMGLDATCPGGSHLSWRFLSLKRRPCSSRMRTHRRGPSPQSYGCVRERCRLADANRHRFPSPRQGLSF